MPPTESFDPGGHQPIEDRPDIGDLRTRYQELRGELMAAFPARGSVRPLLMRLCQGTDAVLREVWRRAGFERHASLAAVGGYGRGELFPYSDVDLLILLPRVPSAELESRIERFVGMCWDIGLAIGHSVRTLDQCLEEAARDVTVQTSLLELRWLAGNRPRIRELSGKVRERIDPPHFHRAKLLELRQRHARYDDTPYSLEPNVKESPGGLRDLHAIRWIAMGAGWLPHWTSLARHGLLTAAEARTLQRNQEFLKRLRFALHLCAGRREDRLVFDIQTLAAERMGFTGPSARSNSERLMQHYYWAAKAVTQMSALMLQEFSTRMFEQPDAPPTAIDSEFQDRQGTLDVIDPDLFEHTPSAILRAFLRMEQHRGLRGMTPRTLRAILRARRHIDAAFRRDPANRALFLQILQQPRGVTHELRRMNQWSVLGRYLPPFRRIVGRMQHDLFHVYTVDQHILMVVRNLRRFSIAEHGHEYPFCTELMAEFDQRWLLYLAALFHDIAKGRGGDHSALGRIDARRFCRQHGLADDDTALVEFLVAEHLTMSSVAQKEDISDPLVVRRFAERVGSLRRLTALYLLTVADIRGTSPKVWNAWKGKLLRDLFDATKAVLEGAAPGTGAQVQAHRTEAIRLLNAQAISAERYQRFWAQLDTSYFIRNDPQDVAWHARVFGAHVNTEHPIVRARMAPIGEGFQIAVYLKDQQDLFARVCEYFVRKNLSVLDARIHTTRHGYALDSFLVVDPHLVDGYRDILDLVESELTETLRRQAPLSPAPHSRLSRRSRYFPIQPSVDMRSDETGHKYLLSVAANDRTGLLYTIAQVLVKHGISLFNARIATLGERAEDVFVIDGPSLSNPRQQIQFESDLLEAIQP